MKKFETLYALDKKGNIRSFEIEITENNLEDPHICSFTGLLDGKKVEKLTEIRSGKQGRSLYQQAFFQAQSKWNEKIDEGYKSFEILIRHFLNRHPDKACHFIRREDDLSRYEEKDEYVIKVMKDIKWNTSRSWCPLPMLAEPFKKVKIVYPMIAQPKLDGVRCIAIPDPIRLCSRGGKFYKQLDHIEEELKIIFDQYPRLWLDGELYNHDRTLNEISGAVRKETREIFDDVTWIQYHVYDIPAFEGDVKLDQDAREENRFDLIAEFKNLKYIKFVDSCTIGTDFVAKEVHDVYVEQGYEGLILRDPHSPYMFSFRDKCLVKYKAFIEEEFECTGVDLKGATIDTFNFILITKEGEEFKCRAKGSHILWQRYYENPPIGKMVTVRYINRSHVKNVPEKGTVKVIRDYE